LTTRGAFNTKIKVGRKNINQKIFMEFCKGRKNTGTAMGKSGENKRAIKCIAETLARTSFENSKLLV